MAGQIAKDSWGGGLRGSVTLHCLLSSPSSRLSQTPPKVQPAHVGELIMDRGPGHWQQEGLLLWAPTTCQAPAI